MILPMLIISGKRLSSAASSNPISYMKRIDCAPISKVQLCLYPCQTMVSKLDNGDGWTTD
eukprot:9672717-Ditylum_brightwellii.AAC.1